jgi:DmsE family decaheme c-type cytochrome
MSQKTFKPASNWLMAGLVMIFYCPVSGAQDFSSMGADSCLPCHGEGSPKPATDILFTKHASRSDPQAPFSKLQCETCHGPGEDHVYGQQRGENRPPVHSFGPDADTPVAAQNNVCLSCHETGGRMAWFASRHETAEVGCASCHQVHRPRDRVFDPLEQQETCFGCHPRKRSDTLKASSHPLRFGSMACSDCHDPHNGENDFLLRQGSVNETCYTCHAEKQGPYLWEHAPASEDCSLCHSPHGSNHPGMLTRRPPLLCQQCHSPGGHPGNAYTSETFDDEFSDRFMLGRACLNCHSQVHGSNHPSGSTLHR